MAWYFQKLSKKKATKKFSYGFQRFSLLGAILNSIILLIGSILVLIQAIPRLISPEVSDAKGMMWFAFLGIIVNGAAVLKLKKGTSINERVVSLHLLEDVLGWVAVLVVSIIMQFYNVPILDPILSITIAFFILYNVFKNGQESIVILLQGAPLKISVEDITSKMIQNSAVKSVHDAHLWSMDGEYHVYTAHVVVNNENISWQEAAHLKRELGKILHDNFGLEHVTLEIEISEVCEYIDCV